MPTFPHGAIPDLSKPHRPGPIEGIDLGWPQGVVDWSTVGRVFRGELASTTHPSFTLSFAYVRATSGASGVDPQLTRNRIGAAGEEIPHGYYHAAIPDGDAGDAIAEAQHFLRNGGGDHALATLRPMVDVELRRKSLPLGEPFVRWVLGCCDYVRAEVGDAMAPFIYSYGSFWEEADGPGTLSLELVARLLEYPWWQASYVARTDLAKHTPALWRTAGIAMWQCSGDIGAPSSSDFNHVPLRVPGIGVTPGSNPVVDRNVLLHDGGLDWLAGRAREAPPTQPVGPANPLGWETRAEADLYDGAMDVPPDGALVSDPPGLIAEDDAALADTEPGTRRSNES